MRRVGFFILVSGLLLMTGVATARAPDAAEEASCTLSVGKPHYKKDDLGQKVRVQVKAKLRCSKKTKIAWVSSNIMESKDGGVDGITGSASLHAFTAKAGHTYVNTVKRKCPLVGASRYGRSTAKLKGRSGSMLVESKDRYIHCTRPIPSQGPLPSIAQPLPNSAGSVRQ